MDRYQERKKVLTDKLLELVYHGIDPSILDRVPHEHEQYFWEELNHIMAVKKAEEKEVLIHASYLGHVGTINNDPRPSAPKTPQPFFGTKMMTKELEELDHMVNRFRKHLSGEKRLSKKENENLLVHGYNYFREVRLQKVRVELKNGQVMIRNEEVR